MNKKLKSLFTIFLLIFSQVSYCEPKRKSNESKSKNPTFFTQDFKTVVDSVEKYYIDKNINSTRAYTDAAAFALQSLPHPLYIYPEKYFNEREKYEEADEIYPGKTFKLSESDQFLIFDPNYTKVKEIREKKLKEESSKPKNGNEDLKKIFERERIRKSIIASRWEQTKFSKKDFDRIMVYIQDNLDKYSKYALKDLYGDDSISLEDYTMSDVYLAAANGYLNSLDPHSSIMPRKNWDDTMAKIQDSTFEGIGAMLTGGGMKDVIVENPLEGRPAVKAGIRSGDIIVSVDGKTVKGLTLDKVVERIKGPKGTKVTLTLKRKGVQKNIDISVIRATIEMKNVSKMLIKGHEHIAYIKLTGFVRTDKESSDREITKAYKSLEQEAKEKNVTLRAMILDLRNNAGGYLDLAESISDMFLEKGVIVSTKGPNSGHIERKATDGNELTSLPVIILINAKSASASEIVASAIKAHGRGLLLGERTFGKATVQSLIDLPGNSDYVLKITQSRYYSPTGQTIQVVGVEPDIEISAEEDGSFPFQYREENMWAHLPEIQSDTKIKTKINIDQIKEYAKSNNKAEAYLKTHKNDPIKPDIMLIRSLDYIEGYLKQLGK